MVQFIAKIFMRGASNILCNSSDWNGFLTYWIREKHDRHFADCIFKCIFLKENAWISILFSLKFLRNDPFNKNCSISSENSLWRRGDRPLSDSMMTQSIDAYMCHPVPNELINPTQLKQSTRCAIIQHSLFLSEASFTNISFLRVWHGLLITSRKLIFLYQCP